MKKILLTLIISIIVLGFASVLFSFRKHDRNPRVSRDENSQLAQLPASQNTYLTASLNPNFIPMRNWAVEEPDIQAKAAGIFDPSGEKFIYQKNIKEKLPIASLTKIMTAIIALENLSLDEIIIISKKAVMTEGENGRLIIGEKLSVRDLLYIMLIESSNDAAVALANARDEFISLMNKKAEEIGLEDTNFVDPAGINVSSYSTITDLVKLAEYSFAQRSLIWQILSIKEIDINSQGGTISHHLINTNKLLSESADWQTQIIGGKTGFTEEAGGCMLTMARIPDKPGEYLITVILGSENRELETKKLIEWIQKAYVW